MIPRYLILVFLLASTTIFGLREAAFLRKYNDIRSYKTRYIYNIASIGKYRWAKFVTDTGYEIFTRIIDELPLDSEQTLYHVHENYRNFSQFGMDNYEPRAALLAGRMVDIYITERIQYVSNVATPVTLAMLACFTILLLKSPVLSWEEHPKKLEGIYVVYLAPVPTSSGRRWRG